MNMKALGGVGEHARGGPLLWPELETPQHAFIPAGQFPEQSTLPLHMDGAREHFDAGNPDRPQGAAVRRHNLTRFHAPAGQPFCQRRSSIVPRPQCGNGGGLQAAPNIFPGFFHFVAAMYDRRSQINQLSLWKSSHKAAKPQTGSPHSYRAIPFSKREMRATDASFPGSARALACCRWRLADDFLWLKKRSTSARRRNWQD